MRHIKSIILKRLKNLNNPETDEKEIYRKIEETINQKSASTCSALFYKNKSIYIKCNNSVIANELRLIQEEIKKEINDFFNKKVLTKVIIKVK